MAKDKKLNSGEDEKFRTSDAEKRDADKKDKKKASDKVKDAKRKKEVREKAKAKVDKVRKKVSKAKDERTKALKDATEAVANGVGPDDPLGEAMVPGEPTSYSALLKVGEGFDLASIDPGSHPGFDGDKDDAEDLLIESDDELDDLQERLYAASKGGAKERVLLVIQGLDTSGKGGIMRHVVGAVDPQGVQLKAFKAPTDEEKQHHWLWRVKNALPGPGMIGVFDRSHYEEVLITKVHGWVDETELENRYQEIIDFERELIEGGTTIIKVMLHISRDEQRDRLLERVERADKHWKYNPGDVDERMHWDAYMQAFQVALERTSTEEAPWFVVPGDDKWYARVAVQQLLLEHLRQIDPQWPAANFDPEVEKQRILES